MAIPSCYSFDSFVKNLTSSYTDQSDEVSIVSTSVVMLAIAALFFNLNLFSRVSDVSAMLNPGIRVFLATALSLFLPVMSYLFSEAKNAGSGTDNSNGTPSSGEDDLSLRARLILMWMLLVELLRKKVEPILVTAGKQGSAGRAGRVAWLGYLVFFNVRSTGRKAVFGVFWVVNAAKLGQRIAIDEMIRRSFAHGKNAPLLTSYMAQTLEQEQEQHEGSDLLKSCKYAVMGEDKLVQKARSNGCRLELKKVVADDDAGVTVITVGKIWTKLSEEGDMLSDSDRRLRRLCLSYALFKLLRRRLEGLPMTEAETRNCRPLIFNGLCKEDTRNREAMAVVLFQVINDEVHFLSEYYHSVLPVVLARPFFLFANYFLFPFVVWFLCLMTIALCGNGNMVFAFRKIVSDNFAISFGVRRMMRCIVSQVLRSSSAFFSTVDLSITGLLFLTFFYEEVWEFIVFLFSNWFLVSLLCDYTAKPHWRPTFHGAIRCIQWVRNKMGHYRLTFKQFSLLSLCRLSVMLPTATVPMEAKLSIMESLATYDGNTHPELSNGKSAIARYPDPEYRSQLSWACKSDSAAEVILIWHIATILVERKYPEQTGTPVSSNKKVATRLSNYCAYLVAFHPELIPDNQDETEQAYEAIEEELKHQLGWLGYYLWPEATRYEKIMLIDAPDEPATATVLQKGVILGKKLMEEAKGNEGQVWKLLAELWTEVIVFIAPSSNDVHVKAHEQALAKGGEFITVLWALVTQTGITRPAIVASPADHCQI